MVLNGTLFVKCVVEHCYPAYRFDGFIKIYKLRKGMTQVEVTLGFDGIFFLT